MIAVIEITDDSGRHGDTAEHAPAKQRQRRDGNMREAAARDGEARTTLQGDERRKEDD